MQHSNIKISKNNTLTTFVTIKNGMIKNKTTLELVEMLEAFQRNGIRNYCSALGFQELIAVLKTRGIVIDQDVLFSRPKKNASSVEIKSYNELFNNLYLLCKN